MYIYFIRMDLRGPIKIGVAKNVEKRLADLQCASPYDLSLITKVECGSRRRAYELERQLHKMYGYKRMRGEWFQGDIKLKEADDLLKTRHINLDNSKKKVDELLDLDLLANLPI